MGLLRWIGRKIGGSFRGLALRSRWLAKRLWIVLVADILLTTRRHWKRLDDKERKRAVELVKESKGRPDKNLSPRERDEARRLLEKFNYVEYGGSVANSVLPFKPFTRLVTKYLVGRDRDKRTARNAADRNGDRAPTRKASSRSKTTQAS
jgi:hypothetical protein